MKASAQIDFLKMVDKHSAIINSLCHIYYPVSEDRKDARQDIILQLWKAFPTFKAASQPSTWLYRVALNTILNKKKKEARRPGYDSLDKLLSLPIHTAPHTDDDLQLLKQIIAQLPDLEKAIMVLHLEGYQNKEIADMLELSASNVSTRMHRIKTRLKENFKSQNYVTRKI